LKDGGKIKRFNTSADRPSLKTEKRDEISDKNSLRKETEQDQGDGHQIKDKTIGIGTEPEGEEGLWG